jgi:Tfp pilus assembly protein FimT
MKIIISIVALALPVMAESLRSANVTAAINEVQVYTGSSQARSAAVGETLTIPSSLQTGRKSRAELTFSDKTLTRLGQNSVFSFREGGRNVELKQGSVLLQVPKNAGGATIRTATVNASITGTTVMFEYSPGSWIKLITLEGTQKLTIIGSNQTKDLPAGKMIIMHPNAKVIPDPVDVDVRKLVATSPLAGKGIFTPLPPYAIALIDQTIKGQTEAKHKGDLIPTDHVITGPGHRTTRSTTFVPRTDQ